jgi:putative ABC transport system permease protein
MVPLRGSIEPAIVSGRPPVNSAEVALGTVTMNVLHKHIGDTVRAASASGEHEYRIVGSAVFPTLNNDQPLADAAMFTGPGLAPLLDPNNDSSYLVARFTAGADVATVVRRVGQMTRFVPTQQLFAGEASVLLPAPPVEVARLHQIGWYPVMLAGLIGVLATLAVGYTLITSVGRRRRDLAILKTIGFDRRQVGATISWHATTVAVIGLIVGIPAGWYVGINAWRLVANGLGVSAAPTIPALALVLTIPAVVGICNLAALIPGRTAARTRPAIELRSS